MNNLGQMGVAMGYSDVSLFVSMTSIWGFFGRIASGTISEHFIKYVAQFPTSPLMQQSPSPEIQHIYAHIRLESKNLNYPIPKSYYNLDSPRLCSS
jgi:hypothetical protein